MLCRLFPDGISFDGLHDRPYHFGCDAAMRSAAHFSMLCASQAVQFLDSLIGLGNEPAFTHDQIVEDATPPQISRTRGNL